MTNITIYFERKEYLSNNLKNYFIKNINPRKTNGSPMFGNYTNATILGWGIPRCHTYKIWLHQIFKNKNFYPETIILEKKNLQEKKNQIEAFLNNERKILKPDRGQSGKGIQIVKTFGECEKYINDNGKWLLQKEIEPMLFQGRKFDIRVYHFILRHQNNWYNIISKIGLVKIASNNYNKKNKNVDGFITNISFNNRNNTKKIAYELSNFLSELSQNVDERKKIVNNLYQTIRQSTLFLVRQIDKENRKYFENAKLKSHLMIFGPDIIINNKAEAVLLETNCQPGLLYPSESIYKMQKVMIDELISNFILPILRKDEMDIEKYNGKVLFVEKLKI